MGLPIRLTTNQSWLLDLMKINYVGPLLIFAITVAPAVIAMMLFILVALVMAAFGAHPPAEEWPLGVGLLASVPWNLALQRRNIRIHLLWTPAWLFCLVMGGFGLLMASGAI